MSRIATAVLSFSAETQEFFSALSAAEERSKGLADSMKSVGKDMQSFGSSLTSFGSTLSTNVSLPLTAAVTGLAAFAVGTASAADEVAKSAREAGLASGAYQELSFAVGQVAQITDEQLNTAFARISQTIGDAAAGNETAIATLEKLGFTQAEIAAGTITTEQAFNAFNTTMQNTESEASALALATDLVGRSAGTALAGALRDGGAEIDGLRQQAQDLGLVMSGETLAASEKFMDSLDVLTKQFGALAIEIGKEVMPIIMDDLIPFLQKTGIPAIKAVVGVVASVIKGFGDLPAPVKLVIGGAIALAAALGPVVVVVGTVISSAGALVSALAPIVSAAGTVAAAIGGLAVGAAAPFLVVGAAIGALVLTWKYFGDDIKAFTGQAVDFIVGKFRAFTDDMKLIWDGLTGGLKSVWSATWDTVRNFIASPIDTIKSGVDTFGTALSSIWTGFTGTIRTAWDNFWTAIKNAVTAPIQAISDKISGFTSSVSGFFEGMYTAVVGNSFVPDMMAGIKTEFGTLGTIMENPAKAATDNVLGTFESMFTGLTGKFTEKIPIIGGFVGDLVEGLTSQLVSRLGDVLGGVLGKVPGLGSLSGIFGGGGRGGSSTTPGIPGGGSGLSGGLAGAAGGWLDFAGDIAGGLISAIGSMRLEGTMNAVEYNTRASELHLRHMIDQILWPIHDMTYWIRENTSSLPFVLDSMAFWAVEIKQAVEKLGQDTAAGSEAILEEIRDLLRQGHEVRIEMDGKTVARLQAPHLYDLTKNEGVVLVGTP